MKQIDSTDTKEYITLESGNDFRSIAKIMTAGNMKMNHATARNQLMGALQKLFANIFKQTNIKPDKARIQEMMNSQDIHNALTDVLFKAHQQILKEKEE
jgi:hypothetical protein